MQNIAFTGIIVIVYFWKNGEGKTGKIDHNVTTCQDIPLHRRMFPTDVFLACSAFPKMAIQSREQVLSLQIE